MSEEQQVQDTTTKPLEIEFIDEKENVFTKRKEITFKIRHEFQAVPERIRVRDKIAALKSVSSDLTFIVKMQSHFGKPEIIGIAHIYEDKATVDRLVPAYLMLRNLPKAERKDALKALKAKKKKKK